MALMPANRVMPQRLSALGFRMCGALALLATCGCSGLRYYAHVGQGQAKLLLERRKIASVLADPQTSPALARRLELAQRARRFAVTALHLPDNRSYTYYVDLQRPYVVWNVFATPRFSTAPVLHCFPVAGCVAYRGYFKQSLAQAEVERLQARGNDVYLGGISAYSTLGWFADPILSSMLRWSDDELDSTIFHELAHQLIYLKGDTAFNESFATFVQRQGLRQWRQARGLPAGDEPGEAFVRAFTEQVLDLRARLQALYAQPLDNTEMERAKQAQIEAFRQRYRDWRDARWPDEHRYDAWVNAPINNATLLPFGLYDHWVGAFAALFAQSGGDWLQFYTRVRSLADEPMARRTQALETLLQIQAGGLSEQATPAPGVAADH
jgi:predicted aminopeptidase